MMQAGTLSQRIEIQKLVEGRDPIGGVINEWQTMGHTWADIRHLSGLETIKADAMTSIVRASVRIRYMAGIGADMRVIHDGKQYNIKAVLQDANRREYTDLICEVIA